ncbi:hypothetical protein HWI79_3661 [Cryptosporidium felis]|nr:hypothetical protein HWI79_3661 [Cryptosporidium felis]
MKFILKIVVLLGMLVVGGFAGTEKSLLKEIESDRLYLESIFDLLLDQYNSMFYHQGRKGGKGKWSNGIGGLPSPRLARKHLMTFLQSQLEEELFGSISIKSYINMCTNIIDQFPKLHHGVGGGILVAINSYQEEEHKIVRGFCTEAGMIYFFKKEMGSLINESAKPHSLVPPLTESMFEKYDAGGNWNDFVENCEDLIHEIKRKLSRRDSKSKWTLIEYPEISDFCEEVSDDIYPNYAQSDKEWRHIYLLQNYIVERKGEMRAPILGIPEKRPKYYVAGRHQSSMYRKCLRALWDMFQYDDVDLKIAGRNQYETLRSFCDAAKNYYTRSGRISASPMINIGEPSRKRRQVPMEDQEEGLVEELLRKQRRKELKEKALSRELRREFLEQQKEKVRRQREARKKSRERKLPEPRDFPMEGLLFPKELPSPRTQVSSAPFYTLPSTSYQKESIVEDQLFEDSEAVETDKNEESGEFGIKAAGRELEEIL